MKNSKNLAVSGVNQTLSNHILKMLMDAEETQPENVRPLVSFISLHNNYHQLLNQVSDSIIITSTSGNILFKNTSATLLLADREIATLLKPFLIKDTFITASYNASLEINKQLFTIQSSSILWEDKAAVCLQVNRSEVISEIQLQEKLLTLTAFIHANNTAFLLLQNNKIKAGNASFVSLTNLSLEVLLNQKLEMVLELNTVAETFESKASPKKITSYFKIGDFKKAILFLQTDLVFGRELFSLCSFQNNQESANSVDLSSHRILEIASHDMREPVRTAMSYLQLIQESFKKEKNDKLQAHTESAWSEMVRVEQLLSDIKELIAFDTNELRKGNVNMKTVAENVLKELKKKIDSTDAMVNISGLPEVNADANNMKLLLYHLLDNALKFHQKDKRNRNR